MWSRDPGDDAPASHTFLFGLLSYELFYWRELAWEVPKILVVRKQILEIRNRPKIRFVPIPGRAHKTQTGCRNDAFKNLAVA